MNMNICIYICVLVSVLYSCAMVGAAGSLHDSGT